MASKTLKRGDTQVILIPYTDSTGTAINLTGSTVWFTANLSDTPTDDTSAAISKNVTSFVAPSGVALPTGVTAGQNTAALGYAWITLTNTDTQSLTPGTYYCDAQVKDASGNFTSSKALRLIVTADITRSTS